MTEFNAERVYYDIKIFANSPDTEIWLGDDGGHLVLKAVGTLRSSLIPGDYRVEFGLGTACYPICLRKHSEFSQADLEAGHRP